MSVQLERPKRKNPLFGIHPSIVCLHMQLASKKPTWLLFWLFRLFCIFCAGKWIVAFLEAVVTNMGKNTVPPKSTATFSVEKFAISCWTLSSTFRLGFLAVLTLALPCRGGCCLFWRARPTELFFNGWYKDFCMQQFIINFIPPVFTVLVLCHFCTEVTVI